MSHGQQTDPTLEQREAQVRSARMSDEQVRRAFERMLADKADRGIITEEKMLELLDERGG